MRALNVLGALLTIGLVSVLLYAKQSFGSTSEQTGDVDAATLLLQSRRRVEARWQQRRTAHAADEQGSNPSGGAPTPTTASMSSPAVSEPVATVSLSAADRAAAGCGEGPPRPYHTILTSSSGGYQAWQCRIMYHHFKLQKSRDPCGEMGGFTRLLTTRSGQDDGRSHSDEIPTVVVSELSGMEARGYVVANRPYSMKQFVRHPEFARRIVEDYVYIAETDHILLRPIPNLATPEMPAAFNFGYMVAWGQANIVNKFVPGLGGKTDPVGPSPVIIHKAQLKQIVDSWYDFTVKICGDAEAVQALGWVREMWGWCIAAGKHGIKHRVLEAFQYEGGSIGNRERPLRWPVAATPVTPDRADMPYYIFHYTYGIEYSMEGLPMELQVGEWSMDKRHYMGGGPPRELLAPPACAHDRAHVLRALWNNASATLPWHSGAGNVHSFNHLDYRNEPLRSHPVASRLLGTGPWLLSGKGGGGGRGGEAYRLEKMWILTNGWLGSSKGHGRWGLSRRSSGDGYDEEVVELSICHKRLRVRLRMNDQSWQLTEADGNVVATLEQDLAVLNLWSSPPRVPRDELAARIEGSGPYRSAKAGAIYVLRNGVLFALGGAYHRYTRWHTHGDGHRITLTQGGGGGASSDVDAHFTDCWVMRFAPSGGLANLLHPTDATALPPKYGAGIAEMQAEWITQPAATLCQDVCAGLTLRRLTSEDRAASSLARSVEDCCSWSWAGFGGLKFQPGGQLITPWGHGIWGAPPEAQADGQAALLAEFAGFKHLLRGKVQGGRLVGSLSSTRCSDNDRSTVSLNSGSPRRV